MADKLRSRMRIIHIACAAGVVLILGAAGAFGVLPMIRTGHANIAKAEELKQQLRETDEVGAIATDIQKDTHGLDEEIVREEKRLPSRKQMDQLIAEISDVAQHAGVKLDGIKSDKNEIFTSGEYKVLPSKLVATGTYAQCYKFLAGLRQMERLTRLESASIITEQKTGEGAKPGEKGECQLRVAIATYMANSGK